MGLLKKFTTVGGIVALLRSPMGQQAIEKAKVMAADPKNREKVAALVNKLPKPRQQP